MIRREYSNGCALEIYTDKALYVKAWTIELGFGSDAPSMSMTCTKGNEDTLLNKGDEINFRFSFSDNTSTNFTGYVYAVTTGEEFVYELLLRNRDYFTIGLENTYANVKKGLAAFENVDSDLAGNIAKVNMFSETPYKFVNRIAPAFSDNTVYGRGLDKMVFRNSLSSPDFRPDPQHWIVEGGMATEYNKHDTQITEQKQGDWTSFGLDSGSRVVASSEYSSLAKSVLSNHKFDIADKTICMGSGAIFNVCPGMIFDLTDMNYRNSSRFPKKAFVSLVKIAAELMGCEMSIELREI